MIDANDPKIVLVTRRTRLDDLLYRYNTVEQARFHVESLGADFGDYCLEDKVYKESLRQAEAALTQVGRLQRLDRDFLPNYLFGDKDIVIVLGQDGLVANTLKYVPGRPVIAVNPDPARFDGVLLPFQISDLGKIMPDMKKVSRPVSEITMAEATLSDGQSLLAVNDFFIGPNNHTSARYELSVDLVAEQQSSSGIIISTGLGSTGWFKSIVAGAAGVSKAIGYDLPYADLEKGFAWDSDFLYYTVREPFPSKTSTTNLVFGKIHTETQFSITSAMPQGGVIFSDGLVDDVIEFSSGLTAKILLSQKKGVLLN